MRKVEPSLMVKKDGLIFETITILFGRRSTTSIFYELLFAFGVEPTF